MNRRNGKLSAYAYAKRRGVDQKTVREAIAAGRITAKRKGRSYLIDPSIADGEWDRNSDLDQRLRGNGNKRGGHYFDEKTALAVVQRRREELKLAEEEGRLLDAAEVESAIAEKQAQAVALLMSLPEEIGPRIAAEKSRWKVIAMLSAEMRRVCELIAGGRKPQ